MADKVVDGNGLDLFLAGVTQELNPDATPSQDVKGDVKVDQKDGVDKPVDPAKDTKPELKPEVKVDDKPKIEPVQSDKPNADVEKLNKQLKDTRDFATREKQKNDELSSAVKKLEAEVKAFREKTGTPDPIPGGDEDPRDVAARAKVSVDVARKDYGADVVDDLIMKDGSIYRELEKTQPWVTQRVLRSPLPVVEAVKVVREHQFFEKYGADPETIREKILAEAKESLTAEIKRELTGGKTLSDIGTVSDKAPGGTSAGPKESDPATAEFKLSDAFPMFGTTFS